MPQTPVNPLIGSLREQGHAGLVLFTSGSTGKPKAILHDLTNFMQRYAQPRPAWTTLSFLLFDHIGGLNTLFHTLYNGGRIVIPSGRDPETVSQDIRQFNVELLPVTPTFLRMWLMHGIPGNLDSLRLVTYGTERMDQHTLENVAAALPAADIRQTYGMSELGILKVRTRNRGQLWIGIDRNSAEWKTAAGELLLKARNPMLGYLNAPSPFDAAGWYATGDLVEVDGSWLRIMGRKDWLINVGGLKVFPAEVEHAALCFPGIKYASASGAANPVTGMHVELFCETVAGQAVDPGAFRRHMASLLPAHARPRRIEFGKMPISSRFKQCQHHG